MLQKLRQMLGPDSLGSIGKGRNAFGDERRVSI
jgi:hypothetical protein